jgi:hypothetical protein
MLVGRIKKKTCLDLDILSKHSGKCFKKPWEYQGTDIPGMVCGLE